MNSKETYLIVYHVVKRSLEKETPSKGCENMFQFAKKIPSPTRANEKTISALCTSVSHSSKLGLECFFQFEVYLDEVRSILGPINAFGIKEEALFNSLSRITEDHNSCMKLGEFVRNFFEGRKVMNQDDYEELTKI